MRRIDTAETLREEAQWRPLSYAETGVVMGISVKRVVQIEARALTKMRVRLGRLGVRAEDVRAIADATAAELEADGARAKGE
jgi:DNA-directed RNA polymerase sigma subunit (sigma70/sigma32)